LFGTAIASALTPVETLLGPRLLDLRLGLGRRGLLLLDQGLAGPVVRAASAVASTITATVASAIAVVASTVAAAAAVVMAILGERRAAGHQGEGKGGCHHVFHVHLPTGPARCVILARMRHGM
jgi:hypothetical protein